MIFTHSLNINVDFAFLGAGAICAFSFPRKVTIATFFQHQKLSNQLSVHLLSQLGQHSKNLRRFLLFKEIPKINKETPLKNTPESQLKKSWKRESFNSPKSDDEIIITEHDDIAELKSLIWHLCHLISVEAEITKEMLVALHCSASQLTKMLWWWRWWWGCWSSDHDD